MSHVAFYNSDEIVVHEVVQCTEKCPPILTAGYVEQFDTLLPELTVREMLLYTAELKCEMSEPLSKKRARVDQLLEVLALQGCAGTLIGDTLARGISGGQVLGLARLSLTDY